MAKEYIKDFYGKVLGTIEENGDKTTVRDFYGKVLGTYQKGIGTKDFYGRLISKSNVVAALLFNVKIG